ncbi:hypothetical protein ACFWF7_29790 [Nocardia sp. NPDC060256]|uniref:hypothetical protein n=1 Tax=unclassified Nocardia TaxID=2637762 RepID=UPI00364C9F96
MIFFGRPGGPARLVLSIVTVGVLGLLIFVMTTLNIRLDHQQRVNETSIGASQRVVDVNDKLTGQLRQLTELTHTAQSALDATTALGPLLARLHNVITPAARQLGSSADGAQHTKAQLTDIHDILGEVQNTIVPLVSSAEGFGDQGKQLLAVLRGLVGDLQASVAAAQTINRMLPLPG